MRETTSERVLAVDDSRANLDVLRVPLEGAGYRFFASLDSTVAMKVAHSSRPDIILLDVLMPGQNGFEVCRQLKADPELAHIPVIFLTARTDTESIVEGFDAGGVDYIVKPYQQEEVLSRVRTHLQISRLTRDLRQRTLELEREIQEREQLQDRVAALAQRESQRWGLDGFVGRSHTIQQILASVAAAQGSDSIRVLITGESGTGKELIARAIHRGSGRADGPFVTVNCASIPAELADSMFFGHRRGAFSGAAEDHRGYFEQANGGTLFLDEIGDMPQPIQAKILRVLEDGCIQPLGSTTSRSVDARVLAATNADLAAAVEARTFRQDLYFRLAQFTVEAPPLRQRPGDIALLAEHFLLTLAAETGIAVPEMTPVCQEALQTYAWPGNVRELKNVMERALLVCGGKEIGVEHLRFFQPQRATPFEVPSDEIPEDLEAGIRYLVDRVLARCDGNVSAAARRLGVHRSRVYRALAEPSDS